MEMQASELEVLDSKHVSGRELNYDRQVCELRELKNGQGSRKHEEKVRSQDP